MDSGKTTTDEYKGQMRRKTLFLFICFILLSIFAIVAVCVGTVHIDPYQVLLILLGQSGGSSSIIIWQVRLPRVIGAILAGMGLAVAGAVMQSILMNPLGSPYTLGISHSAGFGAAFAIVVLGVGTNAVLQNIPYLVSICAFGFSLISVMIIILLAKYRGATPETMILTGVALGSLFTASLAALKYFAEDMQLAAIVFWMFGDLSRVSWEELLVIAVVVIPSAVFFLYNIWNYKALVSGDATAESLGVDVERVRITSLFVASLVTALIVSFTGIIGFIGLVVPHIIRKIIGGDDRFLIPASCLVGALLLLISDTLARTIISPVILPVGILTSFLGAPLFLYLVIRGRRYW